ncbi:MAG: hypothetical protein JXD19_10255 [Deltaproteobacteria bacterium]|nr:hypothetical protein [Deltaproteobacteria bacterium]
MKKSFLEAIGIICFSVFLALIVNCFRSDGLPLVRPSSPPLPPVVVAEEAGEGLVTAEYVLSQINQPGFLIVDARSSDDFRQGHIPGAINIPPDALYDAGLLALESISRETRIITYCEGIECLNAEDLSFTLQETGYENVRVFPGGWEEWSNKKLPVARAEDESG